MSDGLAQISKTAESAANVLFMRGRYALRIISNMVAEIENRLIANLRARVGEVFSELVGLGKEMLQDDTESAKNV
jgi:hypothetical protein